MKTAELGDVFEWRGHITQVLWINRGQKAIGFMVKKKITCPHCKLDHEIETGHEEIESSPNFQNGATAIKTISE